MIRSMLVIALALFAGVANAQEAAAAAAVKVDIAAHDIDKDGALSKEEIAAIKDEKAMAAVVALDADKDGSVSKTEAAPAPAAK